MELSDDEIILMIRKNCQEAWDMLLGRYKKHIICIANKVIKRAPYSGVEREDLYTVGITSIYSALSNYEFDKSLFYPFWAMICEREMYRLINKNLSFAQNFLNNSLSLDYEYGEEEYTILDTLKDEKEDITNLLKFEEEIESYETSIYSKYSKEEAKVRQLHIYGFSYQEIMKMMNIKYSRVIHILRKIQKDENNESNS